MGTYRAAMDVGTNSCRLIIVEMKERGDLTHVRQAKITRIGEGLGGGHLRISAAAMDRTLAVLAEYKVLIAGYPVEKLWLLGTQALREAENSREFVSRVKDELGFDLEIISGQQEAFLSYAGAARGLTDPDLARPLVLDIGAGSTEIFWTEADAQIKGASAPIGSLRLLEKPLDDQGILAALTAGWGDLRVPAYAGAAKQGAQVRTQESSSAGGAGDRGVPEKAAVKSGAGAAGGSGPLVGVGGTATTLGSIFLRMKEYDPDAMLGLTLSRAQVTETLALLEGLTPRERLALPGMPPGREDVMPWGLRILLAAMTCCRRDSVVICDRDLLYGVLYT